MDLKNYKVVYNGERKDTTPYYFPVSATVSRPFTEVAPPTGENLTITGFNWNTNEWETIETVSQDELTATQEAIVELYEALIGGV